jgi:hypothetical protein
VSVVIDIDDAPNRPQDSSWPTSKSLAADCYAFCEDFFLDFRGFFGAGFPLDVLAISNFWPVETLRAGRPGPTNKLKHVPQKSTASGKVSFI